MDIFFTMLSFTSEDFSFIPIEFWIGLVVVFLVIYIFVYKYFTKQLMKKDKEDEENRR